MAPHPLCPRMFDILGHVGKCDTSTHLGWSRDCDDDVWKVYGHIRQKGRVANPHEAISQAVSVSAL
eukprot:9490035-Pyramimonas_sp.AAC.1